MSDLDVTVSVRRLAEAAALAVRLLTARSPEPVHAAVLLCAADEGLTLSATDGSLTAYLDVPAVVHEAGVALVSRRGLAETLAGLPSPEARLAGEGSRLAVKVPGARFALPILAAALPPLLVPPSGAGAGPGSSRGGERSPVVELLPETARAARVARVDGSALRAAAVAVAGAASREHALPIFTGVRLRSAGDALTLLATDRYRLAVATVPAVGVPFEALVPAALLTRIAPVLGRAESVALHVTGELFALSWPGGCVVTPTLGDAYPDAQFERLLEVAPECVLELEADALAGAVERAAAYAGEHGRVSLQTIEGAVLVRAADPLRGESEESVKAVVRQGRAVRAYQARLLADALHAFAGEMVTVRIQGELRATEVGAPGSGLRYLVVPMRRAE